jgi:hypothetical protein
MVSKYAEKVHNINKHYVKELENEVDNMRSALFSQVELRDKIVDWLEGELEHNEPIMNGDEVLTDGTHDIHVGRNECADALLSYIAKLENDNE